ncbi:MAG: energy transducer TonB [Marinilabilia sp.]
MDERSKKDKRAGVIGSTIFHGLLLVLLMVLGLSSIPREEEGILVDFGDSSTGMGALEPQRNEPSGQQTASASSEPQASQPPAETSPETSEEEVETQDFEEAPAISEEEKAEQEEEQRREEEERERREEEERQRQIEEERRREEELEEQRRREEERRRREEEEQQAEEARDNVSDAFSRTDGSGSSQGETGDSGNQGELTGEPNAGNYDGSGKGDEGPGPDLEGRSLQGSLPKPDYESQEQGRVVVRITVDRNGDVIKAEPILRGTTIQDKYLWQVAKEAAEKAQFNADENAKARQTGTITYHFNLN